MDADAEWFGFTGWRGRRAARAPGSVYRWFQQCLFQPARAYAKFPAGSRLRRVLRSSGSDTQFAITIPGDPPMPLEIVQVPALRHETPGELEVVELKGRGHPDTLADRLAEELSRTYFRLSRERYGTILRHQFDKLMLMGGRCDVEFGGGRFRAPVRLLINGRVTSRLGDDKLQFRDALYETAQNFLEAELRNFDFLSDCRVLFEVTSNPTRGVLTGATPGRSSIHHRFRPRSLADIPEYTLPVANDTSLGCAWAPYSHLELLVLKLEQTLTSSAMRQRLPWIGSDVKIMATRIRQSVSTTISVPQVSSFVASAAEYDSHKRDLESLIMQVVKDQASFDTVSLSLNPGDVPSQELLYMKLTGSSIESGDEGVVGRGNRAGGLIATCRPISMEGVAGKNPSYHAGKLYAAAAAEIANRVWLETSIPCEVFVASQMDRPLRDPWTTVVKLFGPASELHVRQVVDEVLSDIEGLTDRILQGKHVLM
jgi:S-adenosylmethionine synthetase